MKAVSSICRVIHHLDRFRANGNGNNHVYSLSESFPVQFRHNSTVARNEPSIPVISEEIHGSNMDSSPTVNSTNARFAQSADPIHQKHIFDQLAKELGIQKLDDWYGIRYAEVRRKIGTAILKRYDDSLINALKSLYPSHEWIEWRFSATSRHFWQSADNQRRYMEFVGRNVLGISDFTRSSEMEKWYSATVKDFASVGGRTPLLRISGGSPSKAIMKIFPEHKWDAARFVHKPKTLLNKVEQQRKALSAIGSALGITKHDDWYLVTTEQFQQAGGASLLARHGRSVHKTVMKLYHDHPWEVWRFTNSIRRLISPKYPENVRAYIEFLSNKLGLRDVEDWYRVSSKQLIAEKAFLLLEGGLPAFLAIAYPHHQWQASKFSVMSKRATQRLLVNTVRKIFPNSTLIEEHKSSELFFNPSSATAAPRSMELDIYLPELKLAFEFQGAHHYEDHLAVGESRDRQARDQEKSAACLRAGITLIEIQQDWDGTEAQIRAAIRQHSNGIFDGILCNSPS